MYATELPSFMKFRTKLSVSNVSSILRLVLHMFCVVSLVSLLNVCCDRHGCAQHFLHVKMASKHHKIYMLELIILHLRLLNAVAVDSPANAHPSFLSIRGIGSGGTALLFLRCPRPPAGAFLLLLLSDGFD